MSKLISQNNYSQSVEFVIANIILSSGAVTRGQLAQSIGLKISTISKFTTKLLNKKLIIETDEGVSVGGRRAKLLSINPDYMYAVGVEVAPRRIRVGVINLAGKIIVSQENELITGTKEKVVDQIAALVQEIIKKSGLGINRFLGVGIGICGIVDYETGVCLNSSHIRGFKQVPVKEIVEQKLKIPVLVDDRVNSMAIAEKNYGLGKNSTNFIYLFADEGIGLGIIMDDNIYRGAYNSAGKIGHIVVDRNGIQCDCGNVGCLETVSSVSALVRQTKESIKANVDSSVTEYIDLNSNINPREISKIVIREAKKGDKLAYRVILTICESLGHIIAEVSNILCPEQIVIGGCITESGDLLLNTIKQKIRSEGDARIADKTEIKISELGDQATIMGTGRMVINDFFRSYERFLKKVG